MASWQQGKRWDTLSCQSTVVSVITWRHSVLVARSTTALTRACNRVGTAITTTIVLARAASHLRSITCQRLLTVVYAMVSVEVISPMVSLITQRLLTLTIAQNVMEIAEMGQDRSSRLTICRPPKTVVFVTHRVALPRAFMIMPGLLVAARPATTV